jgi:hypothetical protein
MKDDKFDKDKNQDKDFPGYKHYPAKDDIYSREKEEVDLDPEDPSHKKAPNIDADERNEKDFNNSMTGDDLDIPGNEEDEAAQGDGLEDEENNYYSLGSDKEKNEEDHGK